MTMIRVTVGDVVVTWSPEYGFTTAGGDAVCEEVASRGTAQVPVLTDAELNRIVAEHQAWQDGQRALRAVPTTDDRYPGEDGPDYGEPDQSVPTKAATRGRRGKCMICNHPMHEPDGCTMTLNLEGTRVPCDCATPAEAPA